MKNEASQFIGQKLGHKIGGYAQTDPNETKQLVQDKKLSRIGDNIRQNAEIRDGWMEVDKALLGDRAKFYPKDWSFRIRPANVEAIRNWSTIDDDYKSYDDYFNDYDMETYDQSYKTPGGEIVHAFGRYGYDC